MNTWVPVSEHHQISRFNHPVHSRLPNPSGTTSTQSIHLYSSSPPIVPVARYSACENRSAQTGATRSDSMWHSAGFRCSAGMSGWHIPAQYTRGTITAPYKNTNPRNYLRFLLQLVACRNLLSENKRRAGTAPGGERSSRAKKHFHALHGVQ